MGVGEQRPGKPAAIVIDDVQWADLAPWSYAPSFFMLCSLSVEPALVVSVIRGGSWTTWTRSTPLDAALVSSSGCS